MTEFARSFALATSVAAAVFAFQDAASADDAMMHHTMLTAEELEWLPAPPGLPEGTKLAVLFGDPGKPGLFIIRGRMPDGAIFPPHWHSESENITILQGTFHLGSGAEFDKAKAVAVTVGGFFSMPPKMQHFAWTEGETVVEVVGQGPFDINYVNPEDDPSRPATE